MPFPAIARHKRNRSGRPLGAILEKAIRQVLPDIQKIRQCRVENLEPRRLLSTAVWTGNAHDNNWATAANWSGGSGTGGAPAAGDDVSIGSGFTTINIPSGTPSLNSLSSASPLNLPGGTMTVGSGGATLSDGFTLANGTANFNGTSSITNLSQTSGTLGGSGSVSLSGTSSWTAGTMNGTGSTTISAAATLNLLGNLNGTVTLSRTLLNNGTLSWSDTTTDGSQTVFLSASLENFGSFSATSHASSTLNLTNNGGTPSFINESGATFSSNGAGHFQVAGNVAFNNAASVSVNAGQLILNGGGTQTGSFALADGTNLGLAATHTFAASSSVIGSGSVSVSSGTTTFNGQSIAGTLNLSGGEVDFNGTSSLGSLNQTGGTLGGSGAVTLNGNSSWTGGTMNGTGSTVIASNVTLTLLGNINGSVSLGRTLMNNGTVSWTDATADSNQTVFLASSAIQNFGAFSVTSHAGGNLNFSNNGGTPSFTNESTGTFTASGAGNVDFNTVAFNNAGAVNINAGQLHLAGGGSQTSGFTGVPGVTLEFNGAHTFTTAATITGNVNVQIDGGTGDYPDSLTTTGNVGIVSGTWSIEGSLNATQLNLSGGTLNLNSSSAFTLNQTNGTLGGSGSVSLTGTSSWTGGTMNGTGSTTIPATATLNLLGNINGNVTLARTLINIGTLSWSDTTTDSNQTVFLQSASIQNFGTFSGTSHASSSLNLSNNGGTPSIINESGATFSSNGAGRLQVGSSVSFNNAASVSVNAGQLNLDGGGTQTGTYALTSGTSLELAGTHTFTATSSVTGTGSVSVSSGTTTFNGQSLSGVLNLSGGEADFNGTSSVGSLNQTGGTLGGTGAVTLSGASSWTAGTMNGTGSTVIPATATLNLLGNTNGSVSLSRTLVNRGTVSWADATADSTQTVFLASSAIQNFGAFSLTSHAGGNLNFSNNGGTPSFTNESTGTFTASGAGNVDFNTVAFNNAGAVNINAGQLHLAGGGSQTSGFTGVPGVTLEFNGAHTFTTAATITGNVNVQIDGGTGDYPDSLSTTGNVAITSGTWSIEGSLNATQLNLSGGTLNLNSSSAFTLNQTNGTLGGSGSVSLTGTSSWTGGTMNGTGSTTIPATATLNLLGNTNGTAVLGRTLINNGTVSWMDATVDSNETLFLTSSAIQNFGAFNLMGHAGANLTFGNNGGTPSFTNESAGTFTAGGAGAVQFGSPIAFNNAGTTTLQGVLLNLLGTVPNLTSSNTVLTGGTWMIQSGAELRFSNASNVAITTDAANITLDGAGSKITQSNGTNSAIATLNHVAAGGSLTLADGSDLAITPTATLTNDGTIGLSAGSTLSINGAFAQNVDGALSVQLASVGSFGQLTATGAATLAGTLGATLASGSSLSPADVLPVLVANSPTGTFSTFAAPPSPAPPLNLNYTSGAVDIVVGSITIIISPPTLFHAVAGVGYSPVLSAIGGTGSGYTFTVTAGALPNGIQLSSGGSFSGNSTLAGSYSFTVTAGDDGGHQGVQSYVLIVDPAALNSLVIGGLSPTQTAGTTQHFTVTAEDAFGNTETADNDVLNFTVTDPHVAPPSGSLVGGVGSFNETLRTAGDQTLTVKDGAVTASAVITVNPAAAVGLQFTGLPTSVTAGVAHLLTVSAIDNFSNIVTSNSDTVNVTSTDPAAQIPATVQLNNGTATFNATLETNGTRVITVRDGTFAATQQATVNPAGVSQLLISPLTGPATAGSPEGFTVTAEDSFGNVVAGDNDALVFSSPTDGLAVLPSGSLSNGQGSFSVTFKRAGSETINVVDGGITGSQSVQISAAPFSHLGITGLPGSQIAGTSENFTVTALDPFGNVATGDNDTLSFGSSDPQAVLPTGALTNGTGGFSVTLKTAGTQSVTVHDGAVSQQQNVQVFAAGLNNLLLSPLPSTVQAGVAQSFTVTARDAFGNTVTNDNEPLGFNSSDPAATLPTGSLSSGTGSFFVTFKTAGARSITVIDNGVTQLDSTVVTPGPVNHLTLNFTSTTPTAGVSDDIIINAFDQFNNIVTGDNDPLGFSSSDLRAALPSGHLTNGTGSFNVTFISAGVQSLTVTDQAISKSGGVTVNPGPTQSLTITGLPPTMTAGTSHIFTVQALDAFGNFATGDNDTLTFSTNDPNATLPIGSLVNGSGIFSVTFKTAGSRFVNATDNGIVGGGDATTVVAAAPFSMSLTPLPSQVTAGVAQGINVSVFDQFGNLAASDNDALSLTGSDPQTVFAPTNLIGGIATVGVTFKTAGPQSVTVHDLTISNTDSTNVVAANATTLSITNLNANPVAGAADGFSVIARDAFGNIAIGDNDTLSFGSSDPQAVLPTGSLTNGTGTFSVTFKTAGSQSILAHDGILLATGPVTVSPGPISSLSIAGLPASTSAGAILPFVVTVHDAFGNVVTGDNDPLIFSSSDGLAVLPSGGLTNGTGSFNVTLNSAGPQTLTVADGSIAQTAHVTVGASTIDHLGITVSNPSPNAGQGITFTVTAFDSHGNVASTDNDTLVFGSSDSKAVLPSGALANGIGNFGATFKTAGNDSLTVTDGSVSVSTNFNVIPGPTASLVVSGLPPTVVAGTSHPVTVTALDAFGNIATGDNNAPIFQTSDPIATPPTGSLFNGLGTFAVTFRTAGSQFVNAIDNGIVGTGDSTTVLAAAPQFMQLSPLPTQITAGSPAGFTVMVFDQFGNVATSDNDALSFTLSDPQASFPTATLTNGQATVGVTFKTAGPQNVTVHDQAISSTDGTTVVAANAASLSILNLNPNPTAGAADSFNLIARDAFGNIATGDNDTLSFTSSDPQAVLPTGPLSGGIGSFSITFRTAGNPSVTAHDGALIATGTVTVAPGAVASLSIGGLPTSSNAGTSLPFTVTAQDAFGNVVSNDNDVVSFNSTDSSAILPPPGSSLSGGMGAFAVTFNSSGNQAITVIDGGVSQTAFVNINANAPATPSMPVLDPSTDSGVKGDNVTNVTTPLLTGIADAGSTVIVFDSGVPIGTTIATAGGTYSFVPSTPLGNGPHIITAQASNSGGVSGMSSPLLLTIDTTLPAVQSVVINDGSAQRSMVDSITIHFSEAITFDPSAFELDTVDPTTGLSAPVSATITPTLSADGMSVTLTFSGSGIINRSLADGNYVLTVHASGIRDLADNSMADGSVTKFHRLFGDVDGDGHVTAVDLLAWRTALNQTSTSSHYVWYLDFDGINVDDRNDYNQAAARYASRANYTN